MKTEIKRNMNIDMSEYRDKTRYQQRDVNNVC